MWEIKQGDALSVLKTMPDQSINTCITSPPYWGLRDYGVDGQLGLEPTPAEYVANLVEVFREVRRVLRDDGTLWLNLGDSYAGSGKGAWDNPSDKVKEVYVPKSQDYKHMDRVPIGTKPKDLVGIPWMVAFALRTDGWYLRSDIIWHKPNAMPENVKDRPTKAHEYVFLLTKSRKYYYDYDAIKEPTRDGKDKRNKRTVWTINTNPFKGAHFAVFPEELVEPCVLAGCPEDGVVLDPFCGSGTTLLVANKLGRKAVGIEINPEYIEIARRRIGGAE